ncbi:glycosyltransferase family 4 protein [Paraburkholderia rhizosphaerae]|uniref:Glycosyltransferase involved in cell wall biosynthesis n=1 Tax=Paraburkholderia rhizosphaerae TaxID=480658 RepID=A0A4R8LVY4_9BURK|nr:glycosyltransferase family 4 protein [Paraburkholderia rhizosphaerae]TDY52003.1 glycosyltransferase involved in cell wall biosynthesis [Paraburkholderia rhizosphaerae]
MKILHGESSRGWGGQEIRTLKEMLALRERGHTVELVCPSDAQIGRRAAVFGLAVHHAPMRGGADVASMIAIRSLLSRRAFDVLNTHSGHDCLVAGFAARMARTPLIVRTRHLALPVTSLATYRWIPHHVIAVSAYVNRYLVSAGVPCERISTIYDGVPQPAADEPATLRAELGLSADATIGCMVAMMRDKKGHDDLIDAVRPLLFSRPTLHFVMAGDGPEFARIKGRVGSLGLTHRIHLLGLRNDVPNVLRSSDFFVLPTHQEALGQSFIEAMMRGLPVIGTRVDGVPELIEDDVNGLLVPARDCHALRASIVRLLDDPSLRTRLAAQAARIGERGLTVEHMADETIACYRRGLAERNRPTQFAELGRLQ